MSLKRRVTNWARCCWAPKKKTAMGPLGLIIRGPVTVREGVGNSANEVWTSV